jgi:hypothetical protein
MLISLYFLIPKVTCENRARVRNENVSGCEQYILVDDVDVNRARLRL